jgi:colicin import membrane protein
MGWKFWQRAGAGPQDPAVLINDDGQVLADADGKAIRIAGADIPPGPAAHPGGAIDPDAAAAGRAGGDDPELARLKADNERLTREKAAADAARQAAEDRAAAQAQADADRRESERRAGIKRDAAAFAQAEVAARRSDPARRDDLEADYVQAAADDHDRPLEGTTRVERLKRAEATRPAAHDTTRMVVADGQVQTAEGKLLGRALDAHPAGARAGADPAVVARMLAATAAGRKDPPAPNGAAR